MSKRNSITIKDLVRVPQQGRAVYTEGELLIYNESLSGNKKETTEFINNTRKNTTNAEFNQEFFSKKPYEVRLEEPSSQVSLTRKKKKYKLNSLDLAYLLDKQHVFSALVQEATDKYVLTDLANLIKSKELRTLGSTELDLINKRLDELKPKVTRANGKLTVLALKEPVSNVELAIFTKDNKLHSRQVKQSDIIKENVYEVKTGRYTVTQKLNPMKIAYLTDKYHLLEKMIPRLDNLSELIKFKHFVDKHEYNLVPKRNVLMLIKNREDKLTKIENAKHRQAMLEREAAKKRASVTTTTGAKQKKGTPEQSKKSFLEKRLYKSKEINLYTRLSRLSQTGKSEFNELIKMCRIKENNNVARAKLEAFYKKILGTQQSTTVNIGELCSFLARYR